MREPVLTHERFLLADDHEDLLTCEVRLFEPEFEVAGTVGDGLPILGKVVRLDPNVIMLNISTPRLNGIGTARRLPAVNSRFGAVFRLVA